MMLRKSKSGFYFLESFGSRKLYHGFSTRNHGNMSYKFSPSAEVDSNRANFLNSLGLSPNRVVQMDLNHGTSIGLVKDESHMASVTNRGFLFSNVDGLITNLPDVALWLLTADCAPFLFYDPKKKVIGLAHVGWRGAIGKMPTKMVLQMVTQYKSNITDIMVGIGPATEKCCYRGVKPLVQENLFEWEGYFKKVDNKLYSVDINGFSINELIDIGLSPKHIFWANYCTEHHHEDFFSYRQENAKQDKQGRFASVICLKS